MFYNQGDFDLIMRKKKVFTKIRAPAPVCATQPSSTLSYSTHPYNLDKKGKEKKSIIFLYINIIIFIMEVEVPVVLFTNPSARAGYDTRSIFYAEFNRFEFRVFLLLDYLPHQGWRT